MSLIVFGSKSLIAVAATLVSLALLGSLAAAGPAAGRTIWLCKPGQRPDPCAPGLSTTAYSPQLQPLRVEHPRALRHPAIDCFYVYPTVSDQPTPIANRKVDPEERSIARYQAARYSQYCRVFAPMYRQITLASLNAKLTRQQLKIGLGDVRRAFHTFLTRENHSRGFVLIGHSQGSFVLRRLIALDVDRKPAVRKRMLSAILLGGNVLVKKRTGIGGDFKHVPACRSARQLGCVIAFSTFDQPPPADSLFGRTTVRGDQVLCTNPAALGGGPGNVVPILPSQPFAPGTAIAFGIGLLHLTQPMPSTVWSTEPRSYRARCVSSGGATVLQFTALHGAQVASPSPDPAWGLHLLDANIALGNLVGIVRSEAAAFAKRAG
jgi:hypothetical protein